MRSKVLFVLVVLCSILVATSLSAQATGTWVSGVGDDANPCSRTAPCKTFAGAISKTATCGEIRVLDPGGFGAVTITKSITIDGTGTLASVLNGAGSAFLISITNAADVCGATVILRNLSANGMGAAGIAGTAGVRLISSVATKLHLEHMNISHQQRGVDINPSAANCVITMKDVDIRHTSVHGIDSRPSAGQLAKLNFWDVRSRQSTGDGLHLTNNTQGNVVNSEFSNNTNGVNAVASTINMTFTENAMSNNTSTGVLNASTGALVLDGCVIDHNNVGVQNNAGGAVISFTNSAILGNNTEILGSVTSVLGK